MPTRDKDERPADGQSQAGEVAEDKAAFEHRRKIIKASAAIVPAIMTIRSGAAVAMTSLHQCVERDAARPAATSWVSVPDEWVRMACLKIKSGNDILFGVPKNGFPPAGNGVPDDYDDWFDASGNITDPNSSQLYIKNVNQTQIDGGDRVYCLAYVDGNNFYFYPKDGALMGDQWVADGSQITGSCLTSVNPDLANMFE